MIRKHLAAAASAVALTISGAASAATFYGIDTGVGPSGAHPSSDAARAAFLAALIPSSVGVENFESSTLGSFLGSSLPLSFAGAGVTGTLASLATISAQINGSNLSVNEFAVNGSRYVWTATGGGSNFFDLTFSTPQRAFGFYGVSISDYAALGSNVSPLRVSLNGGAPVDVVNVAPNTIGNGTVNFFGITSDAPFTTIRLINPAGTVADGIVLDGLVIGQLATVPEPSTALLLGAGLLMLGWRSVRILKRR